MRSLSLFALVCWAAVQLPHPAYKLLLVATLQVGLLRAVVRPINPVGWNVALPDLASRLQALPVAQLDPPDDVLLRGVLVKLFADRQLAIDEQVISYMMLRMPRSLDAARGLVAEIDHLALEEKAAVTRPLVARVMQRFTAPDLFADDA